MMSDEQQRRGPGRPPKMTVTPREDPRSVEDIADEINARRLSGERINGKVIPLREPSRWALHEGNSEVSDNRHYELVHQKGWIPCTQDDLEPGITAESIGYRVTGTGALVRGARDQAVLYKKPKAIHDAIKLREATDNERGLKSEHAAREQAANAAASVFGTEAAETIARSGHIRITDTQQRLG